ncbi:cytochrome P450 [Stutzerimonas stutzeri]|uniref:Cytochrome P450 n=1 Tax=Stutzerimonas stutzeri TaxID=316 RepID=W8RX48_STUST|nr:cytochrome P450 [Stutzerimonas stutzeri]AHL76661.1 cytochrome P450 [Stutzerimonas stutzeri]MCQ4331181.1 cytochrome P450 [Stutzerimonas stutzeri]
MPDIPHDSQTESSLSLLSEGYSFISSRCQRLGSDLFQVRLLMQNTICMSGEEAAKLFYDEQLFQREHAAPRMLQKTLFGQGGVQGLDGEAHRHRKQLFLSLLTEAAVAELVRLSEANWQAAIETWQQCDRVVFMPEVQAILTRTACDWAGVPLEEGELLHRRDQLAAMIDGAGGVGARHWRARKARKEAESWMIELISRVRAGTLVIDESRPLAVVARHLDLDGAVLKERIAAVEMLNLLRPTVAVARFVTYAALELLAHPQWHQRLQQEDAVLEPFAQEVRRLHAFFPFTAARVRKDFEWRGYHFPKDTRVLLDLYGTNRDARLWVQPEAFRPERFAAWDGGAFNFITQGGGDAASGHRCPGEPLAIALLKSALCMLTRRMSYAVPAQSLHMDPSRMPEQPESLLIICDVRPLSPAG